MEAELNTRGPPPPGLLIIQTAINRNKRCLLAYHTHRLSMLQNLYWACGGALPHLLTNSDLRSRMSPHEVDYIRQYNASLMEFRSDFTYELDIMSGIEKPPKEIHVRVRVVRECGVVQTENGSIDFKRGERYVVRRADVENLIVQGFLEEV
jgi:GINS complex subunit 1